MVKIVPHITGKHVGLKRIMPARPVVAKHVSKSVNTGPANVFSPINSPKGAAAQAAAYNNSGGKV